MPVVRGASKRKLIEYFDILFIGFPESRVTKRDQRVATCNSGNRWAVYRKIEVRLISRRDGMSVTDKRVSMN